MVLSSLPWFQQLWTVPRGNLTIELLAGGLGAVGAVASLVIWFGMAAFCLRGDNSPLRAKIFWFVLFFAVAWFGSVAYFFRVYTRQVQV